MSKKIGLVDADLLNRGTRHPNLALMKMSGFYKEQGAEVELLIKREDLDRLEEFDEVKISKVFKQSKFPKEILELPNVEYGGTGFFDDGGESMPDEIEHHMPDYELYLPYVNGKIEGGQKRSKFTDYLDFSIGYTTRGCFRKCSFCVNKRYDKVFKHSPIEEFLDPNRKYIYLWDDNFLGSSDWKEILQTLQDTGKRFQFRQGLDIRLMTTEKAKMLAKSKYKGEYIFAFDHIRDRELISKKLNLWYREIDKVTNKNTKLYVLVGYESQDVQDIINAFERVKVLMEFGALPYIMKHEYYKKSKYKGIYTQLARWCNQPNIFKKKSFRELCELDQTYIKTEGFVCSSMRSLQEFEKDYPEVAAKYFDMKFVDMFNPERRK